MCIVYGHGICMAWRAVYDMCSWPEAPSVPVLCIGKILFHIILLQAKQREQGTGEKKQKLRVVIPHR